MLRKVSEWELIKTQLRCQPFQGGQRRFFLITQQYEELLPAMCSIIKYAMQSRCDFALKLQGDGSAILNRPCCDLCREECLGGCNRRPMESEA